MVFHFTTRAYKVIEETNFEVSSRGRVFPWNEFSPFSIKVKVPHPCEPSIICPSVEALWQGSKVMDDGIVPDYEIMLGTKRWKKGTKPTSVWIGNNRVTTDVGIGRRIVYVPAYYFFARTIIKKFDLKKQLKLMSHSSIEYGLYDFDSNGDIDNSKPISHASILVDLLNGL